jgi:hypothetical protein
MGTLHEEQYTAPIISRSVLHIRNVSYKRSTENQKHTFYVQRLFFENHAVYEIMWKILRRPGRQKMTIGRMRPACWIQTHTENM